MTQREVTSADIAAIIKNINSEIVAITNENEISPEMRIITTENKIPTEASGGFQAQDQSTGVVAQPEFPVFGAAEFSIFGAEVFSNVQSLALRIEEVFLGASIEETERVVPTGQSLPAAGEDKSLRAAVEGLAEKLVEIPGGLKNINTNTIRVIMLHRSFMTTILGSPSGLYKGNFGILHPMGFQPGKNQNKTRASRRMLEIKLSQMKANEKYSKRFIYLTVVEDPIRSFAQLFVVFKDKEGEVAHGIMYTPLVKDIHKKISFGTQLTLMNPFLRCREDQKPVICMDYSNTIFLNGTLDKVCRHCSKPCATLICKRCGVANYCDAVCQRQDWKILKHKHVCDSLKLKA